MRIAVALIAALAVAGAPAGAQRNLRGIVTDSAGYPLPGAEVRILDLSRMARTDTAGRFVINSIHDRVVDLSIRRFGYKVRFVRVSLIDGEGDSLRVVMAGEPLRLPEVEVSAREESHPFFAEYEKRRERGIGTFITHQELEKLNTSYPSDALRRLPGMRFISTGNGTGVRFMSSVGIRSAGTRITPSGPGGQDCQPTIWIDGQAAPGMEIDEIRAQDIFGIEIYRGAATTPVAFAKSGLTQCGAIVIWTRRKVK